MMTLIIDPVAFRIGPVAVHWYGLMYVIGFVGAWMLGDYRARRPGSTWTKQDVSDLIFYGALGAILGGRLGSVLFYNFDYYLENPLEALFIWRGGMSFHGGLLGVALAVWLFARKTERRFLDVADFLTPLAPIGLCAGRIGNFINQELWGKVTDLPWGVVFRGAGPLPRHPSQLYEAFLEGVVLFVVLWLVSARPRPTGMVLGLFLVGYGGFRFLVEFVRLPDANIGYLAFGWLTMGQLLSLPMALAGLLLIVWAYRRSPIQR